jgi:hypothetical protein
MSLPAIAQTIMETVIGHIAVLFLSGAAGNPDAAREAARQMLAAYNAETPEELGLAAEIISMQFHALEALSHAAAPDLSLNRIIRLRGSAVSLSRESHKAQRKLDQLQRARRAGTTQSVQQPQATPPVETAPEPIIAPQTKTGTQSQTQPKPYKVNRLSAKQQKRLARQAALLARANPTAQPVQSAA